MSDTSKAYFRESSRRKRRLSQAKGKPREPERKLHEYGEGPSSDGETRKTSQRAVAMAPKANGRERYTKRRGEDDDSTATVASKAGMSARRIPKPGAFRSSNHTNDEDKVPVIDVEELETSSDSSDDISPLIDMRGYQAQLKQRNDRGEARKVSC